MPATEVKFAKEHVNGHYEIAKTPWATDCVWVPGGKRWSGASSMKSFVPGTPLMPSEPKKSGLVPKSKRGWRWKHSEVEGRAARKARVP